MPQKIRDPNWMTHLWERVLSMFGGLDTRVTALEQGGGGGGGDINVIESISLNGANVPPDDSKRVSLAEADPTVPAWAKAATKPAYTATEVGALSASDVIDSLSSTATDKPLSAAQGKLIGESLARLSAGTIAISDCNALTDTGIYKAIVSTLNTPVASTHCVVYHVSYDTGEMTQTAINTPDGAVYTRVCYGNVWSSWRKLINVSDVVDNLTSTATDKPLSAAQGKALNDGKLNVTDVVDSLTSTATDKPMSAAQGKALNDAMPKTMSISATTDGTGRFVIAKPIDKLVTVHLYDNTSYTILRYLDATQTLVYVRNINTNDPVLNTSFTGSAVYFV